jgi:hypothetical protein
MLVAQNLLERVDNESWSSLWSPRLFYGPLLGQGIWYVNEYILWLFFPSGLESRGAMIRVSATYQLFCGI